MDKRKPMKVARKLANELSNLVNDPSLDTPEYTELKDSIHHAINNIQIAYELTDSEIWGRK